MAAALADAASGAGPKGRGWGLLQRIGFGGGKPKAEVEVGGLISVEHKGHVGKNVDGTFAFDQIPPAWVAVFKEAGIRKRDLRNPAKANVIMSTTAQVWDCFLGAGSDEPKRGPPRRVGGDRASGGRCLQSPRRGARRRCVDGAWWRRRRRRRRRERRVDTDATGMRRRDVEKSDSHVDFAQVPCSSPRLVVSDGSERVTS